METPSISVIVPIYNRADLASRTVTSLIAASRYFFRAKGERVEIILVDDFSNPRFEAPVYSSNETSFYLRVLTLPKNCGQVRATNYGCELASAPYCMILHSDDILEEDGLVILREGVERGNNVSMSVGERSEIEMDDDRQMPIPPFYDNDYLIPGNLQAKVFLYSGFLPCQVMFRRLSFMEVGGAELGYEVNLDGLLWFKICLTGDVVYTQRKVSRYRRHIQSETGNANSSCLHLFDWYATHHRMLSYAQSVGINFSDIQRKSNVLERLRQLAIRWSSVSNISSGIMPKNSFRLIADAIGLEDREPLPSQTASVKRKHSFRPPVGSIPL